MIAHTLTTPVFGTSNMIREIENSGMRLEIGNDFSAYRIHRNTQVDRPGMYPMFDITCSYIDDTNGIWICGFDENDDEIIHTQAARILDLKNRSLLSHLSIHRHKYMTPMTAIDPNQTFFEGPDGLANINGTVCYNGDFWMMPRGLGGHKSRVVTMLLSRLLLQLVIERWAPDFAFAFVAKRLAEKGLHHRYGYTKCERGKWTGPDRAVTEEEYLAWMTFKDIVELLASEAPTVQGFRKRAA